MALDTYYTLSTSFALLLAAVALVVRLSQGRLKHIRGPKSSSILMGNQGDIRYQDEVGDVEFSWLHEFGGAWKTHGVLGAEHLMLADPKALQYILQTSGYRFPKRRDVRAVSRMILGEGVASVHGEQHSRQRKIMNPAFSAPQLKAFLSLFQRHAGRMAKKWKEEVISVDPSGEPIFNVHKWLSRTTLDVIGDAGFNYDFGALDDHENPLSKVYDGLFVDSTLYPHRWDVVFKGLWRFVPDSILYYARYLPSREYTRFRHYQDFMRAFARNMFAKGQGGNGKDIMSILLRANDAEDARAKLSELEIFDQISTLLLAGHDTTSNSLTWWIWELAKNPEWQTRVREEIKQTRAKVQERGDDDFSVQDLEGMTAMHATLKEAMRLHPIVWALAREAAQDDVIPLQYPITSTTGAQINAIPIKKGQQIDIAIASYNRNPEVWGEDADVFRPGRFLEIDKSKQTTVGVYANLLNFSAGLRGCIGWRFSVIEMQAVAATMVENFEFGLPPQNEMTRIKRKPTGLMVPLADGYGLWMGLRVKALT